MKEQTSDVYMTYEATSYIWGEEKGGCTQILTKATSTADSTSMVCVLFYTITTFTV